MLQALWMKSANTNIEVEHWIPSQASDQEMHDVGEPQKEASEEKGIEQIAISKNKNKKDRKNKKVK